MVAERFIESYASGKPEDLPWYHPEPDADLVRWASSLLEAPKDVLDLGAGPSVHGLWSAERGHRVTAVDAVQGARTLALRLAAERSVSLDYHVADVLGWQPDDGRAWDLVIDRGFLHCLEIDERPRWLERVRSLLRPGGIALVKEFAHGERGFGPPGLTAREMLAAIREGEPLGLTLVALERSSFNLSASLDGAGAHSAWTLVARRA